MKNKLFALLAMVVVFAPLFAHAQVTDPQEPYQALLRQVIALLTQQVESLQSQLAAVLAAQASSTIQSITVPADVSTSTPIVIQVNNPPAQPAPVVSQPVLGAVPESCTLTVKPTCHGSTTYYPDCKSDPASDINGDFSWSSTGIATSTQGILLLTSWNGVPQNTQIMKPIGNKQFVNPITQANGEAIIDRGGSCNFGQMNCVFQLSIGDTSCSYTYSPD